MEEEGRRLDIQAQEQSDDNENGRTRTTAAAALFPTIYKLSDDDGYLKPYHVSTGPYCRRTSSLCREAEKQNCLTDLSKFAARQRQVQSLELDLRRKIGEQLRSSAGGGPWSSGGSRQRHVLYYDDIPRRRQEEEEEEEEPSPSSWLAEILLLDGCYLFANFVGRDEVMTTATTSSQGGGGGSSTTRTRTAAAPHSGPLVRDTWYLLQNQIPFFVLEEIYMGVTGRAAVDARRVFTSYARTLLRNQKMYNTELVASMAVPGPDKQVFHLLDLLHTLLVEPLLNKTADDSNSNNSVVGPWHRATEYQKHANVVFRPEKINGGGDDDSTAARRRARPPPVQQVLSVLDVRSHGREVMVPRLHLDGHTCTLLHNLVALERHHQWLGTHVTAYCAFMSKMASTRDDVEHLVHQGVIESHLEGSPDDVAAELSRLGSNIVLDINDSGRNYLKPLWHHLERRYQCPAHNVIAWLSQTYFTWREIAVLLGVVSALILLVAGVLSAVYQILSYKHQTPPPSGGH